MRTRNGTQYTWTGPPPRPEGRQLYMPDGVWKGRICRVWPKRKPLANTRSKGMKNRGNECYRIALLQTLLHVPQMYQYLGNVHKKCNLQADECVMCATQMLWQVYWNDDNWPIDASLLRNAEESLASALKASVPAGTNTRPGCALEGLLLTDQQAESNDFMHYLLDQLQAQHDSSTIPFDQMFGPGAQAEWTCNECGQDNVEQLPSDFLGGPGANYGIELWIDRPRRDLTLKQYLRHRLVNNTDNRLQCNSAACNGSYGSRTADYLLTSAPEVLTIKLQRVAHGVDKKTGLWAAKTLRDYVHFKEHLNLSNYIVGGERARYKLMGVVAHNLPDFNFGHYIAAVRAQSDHDNPFRTLDDDKRVRKHDEFVYLQDPESKNEQFFPAVLVYARITA